MNQLVSDFEKGIKVAVWDLETTNLRADYGYVLCAGVLDALTGKKHMIRIDDPRNPNKKSDKWVVQEAVKVLNSYNLIVGWYTEKFDVPFLNSRAIFHNLPPLVKEYRRDLWYTSKFKLKLRSNRLAVVGEFLFGKTLKDAITPDFFTGAIRGEKKSLNYVASHCMKDLHETLRIYKRLLPLIPTRLRK